MPWGGVGWDRLLVLSLPVGALACGGGKSDTNPMHTGNPDSSDDSDTDGDTSTDIVEVFGCDDNANPSSVLADNCVLEAPCSWSGSQTYEYFGWRVVSGDDVDGDGRDDMVVAALTWDDEEMDVGRVSLISGAALDEDDDGVVGRFSGSDYTEYVGYDVAIVGDVNGDGLADTLVGARGNDDAYENAGEASLLLGAVGGWGVKDTIADASFLGESEYGRAGTQVEGLGDVDGDGLADMGVTGEYKVLDDDSETYREGRVSVILGRDSGWVLDGSLADADAMLNGSDDDGAAGTGLTGADFDGDGLSDIAVGAPYDASTKGRVFVLPGNLATGSVDLSDSAPVQLDGESSYDAFGWSITAGDLTGDGVADLVVGAPLDDSGWNGAGIVRIYEGNAAFFDGTPEASSSMVGEFDDQQLGTGLNAHGDVNGDGINDLLSGAIQSYSGILTKSGKVYLTLGGANGLPASAADADGRFFGAQVKNYLGNTAAMGDLNGDGFDDLMLGAGYSDQDDSKDVGALYLFWGE